jgi:1,4-dihydroxy-2-naphthoate octaprenyltransferase
MKHWIQAARPRTLILGLCGPSFVALYGTQFAHFNWASWGLFTFTLLALQIVSNFANDLGDGLKGSDKNRQGEERMLSSGKLSVAQFKIAIISTCILAFSTGVGSLFLSDLDWQGRIILFGIGILAIAAALTYTLGKKAYGYQGLGDVSVMLFFGFCAVAIPLYLCTGQWDSNFTLPSVAIGLLSVAVLNLNNIRDMDEDKANNKNTLAVKLGPKGARFYHFALLMIPLPLALSFMAKFHSPYNMSIFFVNGILVVLAFSVLKSFEVKKLDAMMKFHAIGALIFSLTFGVCCGVFS